MREQDRPSPPAMRASRLFPRSCRQCRWQAACQFRRWSARSEEHTSELQSLMRLSYAVFCLKKKNKEMHIKNDDYIVYRLLHTSDLMTGHTPRHLQSAAVHDDLRI